MKLTQEQKQRIHNSIILAAVGDAMGFYNGKWEFNFSGPSIWNELKEKFSDIQSLPIHKFMVSDDTVMHKGTIFGLSEPFNNLGELMTNILKGYIAYWKEMPLRAPGPTCTKGLNACKQLKTWDKIHYNPRGGGCGGSMRAMAIGLFFSGPENREWLVKVSIESGRITHNHVGFMGACASAVFTAFAFEQIDPKTWGMKFIKEIIPLAKKYLQFESKRDWEMIAADFPKFEQTFEDFLKLRKIFGTDPEYKDIQDPQFPEKYGFEERDEQYKKWSHSGWGGSSGDDSVMIAYDAFLGAKGDWIELVKRGIIHGGDNDSTGTIAGSMFGAFYTDSLSLVPAKNFSQIEMKDELETLCNKMIKALENFNNNK